MKKGSLVFCVVLSFAVYGYTKKKVKVDTIVGLTLLIGVLVYGEEFTTVEMMSFGLIWSALVLYSVQMVKKQVPASTAA